MRFLNSVQDLRERAETEEEASLSADEPIFTHARTHTQTSVLLIQGVNALR